MPSRVTQGMLNTQLLSNLSRNMNRMNELQNQLSTGRRINKPSDDPVGITFSLRYRSELTATEQYQRNVDAALSRLDYMDTVVGQAGDILQRVRELAVQGANGTNPDTAMQSIKAEVMELYKQLVDIGNSKFNGKYVFNGEVTDQKPYTDTNIPDFTPGAVNPSGERTDDGEIKFELGAALKIPVNVTGNQVFGDPNDPADANDNAFLILENLIRNLEAGDYQAVGDAIDLIDSRMDKLLNVRAEIGARINRIELIENRLGDTSVNLQELQSRTEDADIAAVITNLKMSENVYQASLSAGARIIRPSLVDFLS